MDLLSNNEFVSLARRACSLGDPNAARAWYQKAAYEFAKLPAVERDALKEEIAEFAKTDIVYIENIAALSGIIEGNPGVLQSELVKGCVRGSSGYADEATVREVAGYVLYYAEVLGDLVRVKSGRSYKLYLPNQQLK